MLLALGLAIGLGIVAFWKAEPVGRAIRTLDGGRLGRADRGFGTGAQAYITFVRMGAGPLVVLGSAAFVRMLLLP